MGWTTAKTGNAYYFLEHGMSDSEFEPHNVDAFVIQGNPDSLSVNSYTKIRQAAIKENKPIFFVQDENLSNKKEKFHITAEVARSGAGVLTLQTGFGIYLFAPLISILTALPVAKKGKLGKTRNAFRKTSSIVSAAGLSSFALKSAFTAEQSEAIAELLAQKLGRKPKIQLISGAISSSLKEWLEHPKMRRFYLKAFPFKNSVISNMRTREATIVSFNQGHPKEEKLSLNKEQAKKPKRKWFKPRTK